MSSTSPRAQTGPALDARLRTAIQAMDLISRVLVRTVEGPRGLLEEVVRAAGVHLDATWTLLVLVDGELQGTRPRCVAATGAGAHPAGQVCVDETALPRQVTSELTAARSGRLLPPRERGWVRVPVELEGRAVGVPTSLSGLGAALDEDDLTVLRTLANQAAVSLHTSQEHQVGLALQRRAQRLVDETTAQSRALAVRTRELVRAETGLSVATQRLQVAQERELLDAERRRIAHELHDSVTQVVLAAGMAVEVARGEAAAHGPAGDDLTAQLVTAKALAQRAVEQLRSAIYALHQEHRVAVSTLPELVGDVLRQHDRHLHGRLRVRGSVVALPGDAHRELTRSVAEALFNVAAHAQATRVVVGLYYLPTQLRVTVDDDGGGDPRELSQRLRLARFTPTDGCRRGLVDIDSRIGDLGGAVGFRRSRLGGLRVRMQVPIGSAAPGSRTNELPSDEGATCRDQHHQADDRPHRTATPGRHRYPDHARRRPRDRPTTTPVRMRSNISGPRTHPGMNSSSTMRPVRSSSIPPGETECVTSSRPSRGTTSKCAVRTLPRPRVGHALAMERTTTKSSS